MATRRIALIGGVLLILLVAVGAAVVWLRPGDDRQAPTVYELDKVSPGVVIFAGRDGKAYAVAADGTMVHTWAVAGGRTIGYARPLEDGTLLARLETPKSDDHSIAVLDADANILLEVAQPAGMVFHHDHSRLANGNDLVLCYQMLERPDISPKEIQDDCVVELDPDGNVVWLWQTADHFDEFDFSALTTARISEHAGDWAHANAATAIPQDTTSTDPRFRPGNVIVSYRSIDTMIVIDRETGEIVWQTNGLTLGQHDSHFISGGLPGGGHILVLDNGIGGLYGDDESASRYYSRVLEIDPATKEIAWEYNASKSGQSIWSFFTWFIGSAERLPNGDTLITEGAFGRIFEVTVDGQIVWEYTSPIQAPTVFGPELANFVNRAHKVGLDWPGL
jgi:hypothetical protein